MLGGGDIKSTISLDDSQLKAGLSSARGSVDSFATSVKSLASTIGIAFSVGAVVRWSRTAMREANSLMNTAQAMRINVESLQALNNMFNDAGVSGENLRSVFNRLDKSLADASTGNQTAINAFKRLNIELDDLKGKSADQILEEIAKGFVSQNESMDATRALFELLGRDAGRYRDVLRSLAKDGLQEIIDKQKELGDIQGEEILNRLSIQEQRFQETVRRTGNFFARHMQGAVDAVKFVDLQHRKGMGYIWGRITGNMNYFDRRSEALKKFYKDWSGANLRGNNNQSDMDFTPQDAIDETALDNYLAKIREITERRNLALMDDSQQLEYWINKHNELLANDDFRYGSKEYIEHRLEIESVTDKILNLEQRISNEKERQNKVESEKEARLKRELELIRLTNQERIDEASRGVGIRQDVQSDRLSRIGMYIGGQTDPLQIRLDRQLQIMRNQENVLREIARNTERRETIARWGE